MKKGYRMKAPTRALHEKWKKYKTWQKKNINNLTEATTLTRLSEFKEAYSAYGNNLRTLKYNALYATNAKTRDIMIKRFVESEKKRYQKALEEGIDTNDNFYTTIKKVKESKMFNGMSTREFADLAKNDIQDMRLELLKEGKTKKEINLAISSYFFGS